jgi:diacylglycerol kinase (ATP)
MPQFRSALILYNPSSGRHRDSRATTASSVVSELRSAGIAASAEPTQGPGAAATQAATATRSGCEAVIACGGDGTVHDILQGIAGTEAALGVVPLGTANALAVDLRIPLNPRAAVRALLSADVRRVSIGRIEFQSLEGQRQSRYFIVGAGIGPDALLAFQVSSLHKRRLGIAAYYFQALRLWATHDYPEFDVELVLDGLVRKVSASEVLAIRCAHLGGLINNLVAGAGLERNLLRVGLFTTRSRVRYLQYILRCMIAPGEVPGIELLDAQEIRCMPRDGTRIHAEADGEPLGLLPATVSVVPNAIKLLMPVTAGRKSKT